MSRSMEQFGSSAKWNSGFGARAHVQRSGASMGCRGVDKFEHETDLSFAVQ